MLFEIFKKLDATKNSILHELSALMTDEMLWVIAEADYGYKKEECFSYLKGIVSTKKIPPKIEFVLGECLQLTHYSEPKNREEHIIRAFSATLLLILENTSNIQSMCDEDFTLASLIDSVTILKIAHYSAQELIVWRMISDNNEEKEFCTQNDDKHGDEDIYVNGFFAYALLLLMVFNKEDQEYIESYLTAIENKKIFQLKTNNFNYFKECRNYNLWKRLSNEMIQWKEHIMSKKVNSKLDIIIDCIVNNKPIIYKNK